MQQCHQDTGTTSTNRVTQGNRPAVDVYFVRIKTQVTADREKLGGKCFVGFDKIDILQ